MLWRYATPSAHCNVQLTACPKLYSGSGLQCKTKKKTVILKNILENTKKTIYLIWCVLIWKDQNWFLDNLIHK